MVWTELHIYRAGLERPYAWIIVAQDEQALERAVSDAEGFFSSWHPSPRDFSKMQWAGSLALPTVLSACSLVREPCPRWQADLERQGWAYLDAP